MFVTTWMLSLSVYAQDKYLKSQPNKGEFIPLYKLKVTPKPEPVVSPVGAVGGFFIGIFQGFRGEQNQHNPVLIQSMEAAELNKRRKRFQLVHGLPNYDPYNLENASKIDSTYFNQGLTNTASNRVIASNKFLRDMSSGVSWQVDFKEPEKPRALLYRLVPKPGYNPKKEELIAIEQQNKSNGKADHQTLEKVSFNRQNWTIAPRLHIVESSSAGTIEYVDVESKKQAPPPPKEKKVIKPPEPQLNFQLGPHGPLTGVSGGGNLQLNMTTPDDWYRLNLLLDNSSTTHVFSVPILESFKVQKVISTDKASQRDSLAEIPLFRSQKTPRLFLHRFSEVDKGVIQVDKNYDHVTWSITSTKHEVSKTFSMEKLSDEIGLHFNIIF